MGAAIGGLAKAHGQGRIAQEFAHREPIPRQFTRRSKTSRRAARKPVSPAAVASTSSAKSARR